MSLPLPHPYDRYRLIALILSHKKALYPNLSQIKLEGITHVDQTTISRLLNPDSLGEKGKKKSKLNRTRLLALTQIGLKMDHYHASLILWLAEGEDYKPWTTEELSSLQIGRPDDKDKSDADVFQKEPWSAHTAAIDLLEETCLSKSSDASWYRVETELLQGDSNPEVKLFERLRTLENGPGQRMLVSKYPSSLVTADTKAGSELILDAPEEARATLKQMHLERHKKFRENLAKFGERSIHSVPSLQRFVNKGFNHPTSVENRRSRFQGLIKYLNDYPAFQVGLLEDIEPEVEIAIKSTQGAVIRGTARELSNHPLTAVCGPRYMYWDDERAILNFYLQFERLWAKLHDAGLTDKKRVIAKLKEIAKASNSH